MAEEYIKVAQTDDVPPGGMKQVEVDGELVALVNAGGEICAIGGECTHAGGFLAEGYLEGDSVECPLHGASFNVKTGDVEAPPAEESVPVYQVKVEGTDILIAGP